MKRVKVQPPVFRDHTGLRKSFNRPVHLRVIGMLWLTFAQSAVPGNSLQLDCITPNSRGTPINFKKQTFLNRGLHLGGFWLHVLFYSCTVSVKINSKLLSTGPKLEKTKLAGDTDHGELNLTKETKHRQEMFR